MNQVLIIFEWMIKSRIEVYNNYRARLFGIHLLLAFMSCKHLTELQKDTIDFYF